MKTLNSEGQLYLAKPKAYEKYMTNDEEQYIFPTPKRMLLKLGLCTLVAIIAGTLVTLGTDALWILAPVLQFIIGGLFSIAFLLLELIFMSSMRKRYLNNLYRHASSNVGKNFEHMPANYTK